MVKQWRVISDDFDICTDVTHTLILKGEESDKEKADTYLRENSPKYADFVKQLEIWKYYGTLKSNETKERNYFVGTEREKRSRLIIIKIYHKLRRLVGKL